MVRVLETQTVAPNNIPLPLRAHRLFSFLLNQSMTDAARSERIKGRDSDLYLERVLVEKIAFPWSV